MIRCLYYENVSKKNERKKNLRWYLSYKEKGAFATGKEKAIVERISQ